MVSHVAAIAFVLSAARPVASFAARLKPAAGARAGVIGQLFPGASTLLPMMESIRPTTFTQKRRMALRWRVAQARAAVDRSAREIKALEARATPSDPLQREARELRLAQLRREAGVTESRILLLKQKQRQLGFARRAGWVGTASRFAETWLASEERSARVLLSQLLKQRDPWDLVRADTIALLRLGSNTSLLAGYAQLRNADRAPSTPRRGDCGARGQAGAVRAGHPAGSRWASGRDRAAPGRYPRAPRRD